MVNHAQTGCFYGVGIGPGDPELLTLKALRLLREADVVAAAHTGATPLALGIVAEYIRGKETLLCPAPMTRDPSRLLAAWEEGVRLIAQQLEAGRRVVFVTLGDPTIYSTCGYLHKRLKERGFSTQLVPGVTSFCAAAAAAGESLCEGDESLLLVPATSGQLEENLDVPANRVVMKAGRSLARLKTLLARRDDLEGAVLAENCGLPGERLMPLSQADGAGYFSTVLVLSPRPGRE